MIKFSDKLVPKNQQKKWDRENKKRDSSKFWTKNQDCPSKSGTVGKYAMIATFTALFYSDGGSLSMHPTILGNRLIMNESSVSCRCRH